ncbi:GntR family transcriptional regulator [Pandoraea anhela]|uniref:HTH-type transcriptional repressor RspR n=1 Tax=Pandoraea anhela TaxID=2508295 RepID=A0A5E4WTH3_9BURK|nr:GntR family transcriptional regulator [Pandoraea anhela]VVE26276.1 HTH-type transcriptional repressor RspR [Pandoraea anhela]
MEHPNVTRALEGEPERELTRQPLGNQVYEALLSRLISLKLPPGARISIDALARELNVSQTPIRAALIRLEAEGLVAKTHNIGFSAAPMPTRQRFEEIYDLRLLLEPYMAGRAAQQMTTAQKDALLAIERQMTSLDCDDAKVAYGRFAVADAEFHAWISEYGHNALAAETLARLHSHMHLFRLRFHSQVTEEAIGEHRAILDALLGGDAERAAQAMRTHILRSRERLSPFFGE